MTGSAVLSDCQRYRYRLERIWDPQKPKILWIGMNPSTADAQYNDPTCTREINFSKDWGFGHYLKSNILDYRATFPKDLPDDPNQAASQTGRQHLLEMAQSADLVIAAWGKLPAKLANQGTIVAQLLNTHHIPLKCMGRNKDGSPKHPLYLPKTQKPQDFIL